MAHSEMYEDGSRLHQFFSGEQSKLAEKFGRLSQQAFESGAVKVEQQIVNDNDRCPCGSELRFDLCCKKTKMRVI